MQTIKTESIRYLGSKKDLIGAIFSLLPQHISSFFDAFSGSTRVSQAVFQHLPIQHLYTNDIAPYSKILAQCYLQGHTIPEKVILEKIQHLNNLQPQPDYFARHYGIIPGPHNENIDAQGIKRPLTFDNAAKIDAIRNEIDVLANNEIEKSILLTSLLLATDKVFASLGHQVSYIKGFPPRCLQPLQLHKPRILPPANPGVAVHIFTKDTLQLLAHLPHIDIVYIDPPYGTNNEKTKTTRVRYASYYHFWTTLVLHDKPEIVGNALRRKDVSSDKLPGAVSVFESTKKDVVLHNFTTIFNANAKFFIVSYNNQGKLSKNDILDIASTQHLTIQNILEIPYKQNVQKILTTTQKYTNKTEPLKEYLFLFSR